MHRCQQHQEVLVWVLLAAPGLCLPTTFSRARNLDLTCTLRGTTFQRLTMRPSRTVELKSSELAGVRWFEVKWVGELHDEALQEGNCLNIPGGNIHERVLRKMGGGIGVGA